MPLNATTLRNLIDTTFAGLSSSYADAPSRDTIKTGLIQAIASAIVEHLDDELEVGSGYTAVSALPAVSSVAGTDLVRVSQTGTERKATLNDVIALVDAGPEVIVDSDVGGSGTSTTSNVLVDTNIAVALDIGTYHLAATGVYVSSSGGVAMRFAGAAASGLVASNFHLQFLALTGSAGSTASMGQTVALGTQTNNTNGGTVDCAYMLQGLIRVTTAGTLKLQIASATNTFNVNMKSCVFLATKVA